MMTIRLTFIGLLALILAIAAFAASADTGLPEQMNAERGVTVKVKPLDLGANTKTWRFSVSFDTHTGDLSGNPADAAVLIDSHGDRHAASEWEGDPPGGHHRKGILTFVAPEAQGGAIALRLANIGGVPVREFRWQVPAPKP